MYIDFSVADVSANFSEKTLSVHTNFRLDATTVNPKTVKLYKVIDEERVPFLDYTMVCDGKDINLVLNDFPYEEDVFYVFVHKVRDKLGRELTEPYMKTVKFSPNIGTELIIQAPSNDVAIKSKKVHVEVTILDDDEYTLKLVDDASDIVLFSESDLDEMLQLSTNTVKLEVSTDNEFYAKESIKFDEHDSVSTNPYKVAAENIARINNTLSFDLIFNEDRKFFIRARLESRENENYFGKWSNSVGFMIKAEDLMTSSETYMAEMLFSESVFEDEYIDLQEVDKTDDSFTDQEFYIEFNKPVLITKDMEVTEDGLVLIAKGFLIRRDL